NRSTQGIQRGVEQTQSIAGNNRHHLPNPQTSRIAHATTENLGYLPMAKQPLCKALFRESRESLGEEGNIFGRARYRQ
ncbi:hypothetical protein, partial [Pseudomonas sp. EA_35y_Pfl2_R111]|uniref:hypothetical protein n=1 Tax=Pseudomonas sp. EA_35y_Pfl2_R111 TaxID=3088689 RepID=UPI0030DCF83E